MAIQSGIGVGEAQIYDTSGSMNTYARLMQRQQAQRQAEQKALQEQLAKVKTDGLRDKDKTIFLEKYEKAKDLFRQSLSAKGRQKMELQAQMDQELLGADDIGNRSREFKKVQHEIGTKFLDLNFADSFEDGAAKRWMDNDNYDINDERLIKDPTVFKRVVDMSKVTDVLDKARKRLLDNTTNESFSDGGRYQMGKEKGNIVIHTRRVAPEKQAHELLGLIQTDRSVKAAVRNNPKYAELYQQMTPEEADVQAIQDMVKTDPWVRSEKKQNKDDHFGEPTWSDLHGSYSDRHPKADGSLTPANFEIQYNKNFNYEKSQKVNGKTMYETVTNPNATFQKYVRADPPAFALPQIESAYNIATGKNEKMPANSSVKLTGFGYVKTKASKPELKATIVDSDGSEYSINMVDLPVETRNDKHVKMAYQALNADRTNTTTNNSSSATNSVPSGYTNTQKIQDAKGNTIEAGVKNGKWYNTKTGKEIQ